MDLVEKIKESASFLEGMATIRQLSFGMLDMGWHGHDPRQIRDLKVFETEQFSETQLYPDVKENAMTPSFSHIFNGGYSSGYYSYKWAEVLDADAFDYFRQNGIFNKEIAKNSRIIFYLKEVLSIRWYCTNDSEDKRPHLMRC